MSKPYRLQRNSFGVTEVVARQSGAYLGWVERLTDDTWWEATCGDIFCGHTNRYTTRTSVLDLLWEHYRVKHGGRR